MIIDFHTHVFPDKIAQRTVDLLAAESKLTYYTDGSLAGLLGAMERGGVDLAVAHPVMTAPKQFDSINRFAAGVNQEYGNKVISFAGIHPDCEDLDGKMRFIKESGFLGVKIHPDFQGRDINDERYVRIVNLAREFDLMVITHSGVDAGHKGLPVRCTPDGVLDLLKKAPHEKLILGHFGANEMHEEVLAKLCGTNVYFDTAVILPVIDPKLFVSIVGKHGADKILFATDTPWSDMASDVARLRSFGLAEEDVNKILHKNATRLLGLG